VRRHADVDTETGRMSAVITALHRR
jgi:hypothetical protein